MKKFRYCEVKFVFHCLGFSLSPPEKAASKSGHEDSHRLPQGTPRLGNERLKEKGGLLREV